MSRREQKRHWRTSDALRFERVARGLKRRGLAVTDEDWERCDRVWTGGDPLRLRADWLYFGGRLEVRGGRLELSTTLRPRAA